MIDLNETSLVLFDFDNTICIHKDHKHEDKGIKKIKNILTAGPDAYNDCSISTHMKAFMEACKFLNIKLGLISATLIYKSAQAKHEWVIKNYGIDLENYCVGTREYKLDIMIAISELLDIPRKRILLVDDLWENISEAANNGFSSCTPMEVVNYIEEDATVKFVPSSDKLINTADESHALLSAFLHI